MEYFIRSCDKDEKLASEIRNFLLFFGRWCYNIVEIHSSQGPAEQMLSSMKVELIALKPFLIIAPRGGNAVPTDQLLD
jgi:hypothetical protein